MKRVFLILAAIAICSPSALRASDNHPHSSYLSEISAVRSSSASSRTDHSADNAAAPWTRAEFEALNRDFSDRYGFESVHLGSFLTSVGKTVIKTALLFENDTDAKAFKRMISSVKKIDVLEYEDGSAADQEELLERFHSIVGDSEPLLEAKEDGDTVLIYGHPDERSGKINDLIIHIIGEALVCLYGKLDIASVATVAI